MREKKRLKKALSAVIAALFLLAGGTSFAAAFKAEQIKVSVAADGASRAVLDRMADSMLVVAEQVLSGKDFAYIAANKDAYATVLAEVANRVFTGYSVEKVEITLEQPLNIKIAARPWGEITKTARVDFHLSGMSEVWSDLIKERLESIRADVEGILLGVSVDAVDWAGLLAKKRVREVIGRDMPYFKATSDIFFADGVIRADIVLQPVGSSVRGVNYELRSATLPRLLLVDSKNRLADFADKLRGLPIEFVARHKRELERQIQAQAQKEHPVSFYKLKTDVQIVAGEDTQVTVNINSDEYRFWLEGYVDIDRLENTASGLAHIGRLISSKDEVFFEATLYTDEVKWDIGPGLSRHWGDTVLSARYRDNGVAFRLEHDFLKKWRLRIEKLKNFGRPEMALRYRLHDFLALELVLGADRENYLRIVGNL